MTDDSSASGGDASGGSSALVWAVIGVLALSIAGFGFAEWLQFQDEQAQVAAAGRRVQERVRALEAARSNLPKLEEEASRVTAARTELLRVVPTVLGLPELRQAIEAAATRERLAVRGFREKVLRSPNYEMAEVVVTLEGPLRAVDRLRRASIPRVLRWSDSRPEGSPIELTAVVAARPEPAAVAPDRRACERERSRVWLWPFAPRLRELEAWHDAECRRFVELAVLDTRMRTLERDRRDLESRQKLAQELRRPRR